MKSPFLNIEIPFPLDIKETRDIFQELFALGYEKIIIGSTTIPATAEYSQNEHYYVQPDIRDAKGYPAHWSVAAQHDLGGSGGIYTWMSTRMFPTELLGVYTPTDYESLIESQSLWKEL